MECVCCQGSGYVYSHCSGCEPPDGTWDGFVSTAVVTETGYEDKLVSCTSDSCDRGILKLVDAYCNGSGENRCHCQDT
jgi:hypothetical protein